MEFPAISSSQTLNFPANVAGKITTKTNLVLGRTYLRHDRRRTPTSIAASSEDNRSSSTSASRAFDSKPTSSSDLQEWLHFVGVGGCGISALAMLALKQGYEVSGSDLVWSNFMDRLQKSGARLCTGHSESNLRSGGENGSRLPNAMIVSSAIPQNNVEVLYAKSVGIPVYKRDYWLGKLTENHKLIAISGSHGKSTTASMLAYVLKEMGDDLTAVVGANVPQFQDGNAMLGGSETFVLEADEYDHSFLKLSPHIAVVTNLDWEHVDIFPDEEAVKNAFRRFLNKIKKGGHLILCGDSEGAYSLLNRCKVSPISCDSRSGMLASSSGQFDYSYKITTFGVSSSNEWHISSIRRNSDGGSDYTLYHWENPVSDISIQIPGIHNVLNSLAVSDFGLVFRLSDSEVIATIVAMVGNEKLVDNTVKSLRLHLKNFQGVSRRFEMIGSVYGCQIIDDYAHHPTEIRAIMQAVRQSFPSKALLVVFQPHTYSRVAALKDDFAIALSSADQVIITGVYASREVDIFNASGNELANAIIGPRSDYISSLESVIDAVFLQICNDPDRDIAVVTLGAGDITTVGPKLLSKLQERL